MAIQTSHVIGTIAIRALEVFRLLYVGGNWNNGSNAGVSYVNSNSLSNSNANIGSRLTHVNSSHITVISALPHGRTSQLHTGLVAKANARTIDVGGDCLW